MPTAWKRFLPQDLRAVDLALGGQRAQSQRLSWRCRDPQALGLGKGPASPPQSSLHFPLTQKNMHIHRLSLCDLHLSHLCHSFDCLSSQGFLFMFPWRWYLSRGCLGCDDLFRGKKAALNKANITFTCEQVSWAHHSSWSKWCIGNRKVFFQARPADKSDSCFLSFPLSLPSFFPFLPSYLPSSLLSFPSLPSSFFSFSSSSSKRPHGNLKNMIQMNLLTKQTDSQIKRTDLWLPKGKGEGEG